MKVMNAQTWIRKESTSVNSFLSIQDMEGYGEYLAKEFSKWLWLNSDKILQEERGIDNLFNKFKEQIGQ